MLTSDSPPAPLPTLRLFSADALWGELRAATEAFSSDDPDALAALTYLLGVTPFTRRAELDHYTLDKTLAHDTATRPVTDTLAFLMGCRDALDDPDTVFPTTDETLRALAAAQAQIPNLIHDAYPTVHRAMFPHEALSLEARAEFLAAFAWALWSDMLDLEQRAAEDWPHRADPRRRHERLWVESRIVDHGYMFVMSDEEHGYAMYAGYHNEASAEEADYLRPEEASMAYVQLQRRGFTTSWPGLPARFYEGGGGGAQQGKTEDTTK